MKYIDLGGSWSAELEDGTKGTIKLPGTLDESRLGRADRYSEKLYQDENYVENGSLAGERLIATRFTRKYVYEGEASFTKTFKGTVPKGKRIFLEAERARVLRLFIDNSEIKAIRGTLSTPYCFEVTNAIKDGSEIKLLSDNSYKGLPHDNIVYSSAATDETQTNWNGITGFFRLRIEDEAFIEKVNVYAENTARVRVYINSCKSSAGRLVLSCDVFEKDIEKNIEAGPGVTMLELKDIPLKEGFGTEAKNRWDEYRGKLYGIKAELCLEGVRSEVYESFGCRSFGDDGLGHLSLNGRRIFLRSEANCCVHPETGYAPTDLNSWRHIVKTYVGYGVNCLRFHSHCPPKAAFIAADEAGVLIQPELSHWNPVDAFAGDEAKKYYERELTEILYEYGSHPSFVMLTFGNELQSNSEGMDYMHMLINKCRSIDNTRLYAIGSNVFYGEKGCDGESDFYTAMRFKGLPLRATFDGMQGYLNNEYPNGKRNFDMTMRRLRGEYKKPVFSFEVGQYEILPDFDEIDLFNGVSVPDNFKLIREKVREKGLEAEWKKRSEATGELSLLCYREEVEAALRTGDFSGISLLGLQDFPGQGTALVGMLNSHLKSKPYPFAAPERFRSFFRQALPLVLLEKYTYSNSEKLSARVILANYSFAEIRGKLEYRLCKINSGEESDAAAAAGHENLEVSCPCGALTDIGEINISLDFVKENTRFDLDVSFAGEKNTYPVWVYAEEKINTERPESVYECTCLDNRAKEVLQDGGKVYLAPDSSKDALPDSIKSTFSPDFWSVGTFSSQEGSMGLLIDEGHPLFRNFPTEFYTNWQWWAMASQRALILPEGVKSIVTVMDSYAYMRNMGQLVEFRYLNGKVLLSSLGLQNLQQYPECRALLSSIYSYMDSDDFNPTQKLPEIQNMIVK